MGKHKIRDILIVEDNAWVHVILAVTGLNPSPAGIRINLNNYDNRPMGFLTLGSLSSEPDESQKLGLRQMNKYTSFIFTRFFVQPMNETKGAETILIFEMVFQALCREDT
jgi:hypothetical protein